MTRVTFEQLFSVIERALRCAGLTPDDAALCARIHAESTRDGVNSHGLDRIPRLVDYLARGWVDPQGLLEPVQALGALEVYDGNQGLGVRHALQATERAIALAREHGMGLVAVRNTTHWMRGGTYGWHAVEQGMAAIMWTNTESCMPAWGASSESIGNNPLVMAVPGGRAPLVLDMAMSQFSYGRLGVLKERGEQLPVAGGFDEHGQLTRDPGVIQATRRILPTGYWKGSGLAILLDAMAALLSQGRATHEIDGVERGSGTGSSQVFLVFDPQQLGGLDACHAMVDDMTAHLSQATPDESGRAVRWPGASTFHRRHDTADIEVNPDIWEAVQRLAGPGDV
ncbi:2,3-diketo-L-gulonate reductase [Kushneria pakistanensis]|uniref:2,3-diketo-L-gulonate reductase n=1 Tax=Kushneria pakistanensis TaxID=1508770 RepID=A0ABQ3FQI2_9GAMM|nr:3-dehydro-L-gulonate 2-dehydrogenase [Kushneria pakistanensis]GHC32784.1 2,3-diketo-L-gulonate reductase [Kushneria pakistanensis]